MTLNDKYRRQIIQESIDYVTKETSHVTERELLHQRLIILKASQLTFGNRNGSWRKAFSEFSHLSPTSCHEYTNKDTPIQDAKVETLILICLGLRFNATETIAFLSEVGINLENHTRKSEMFWLLIEVLYYIDR